MRKLKILEVILNIILDDTHDMISTMILKNFEEFWKQFNPALLGYVLVYRYTKERNINELRHNSMYGCENNRNSPVYRYTRTAPSSLICVYVYYKLTLNQLSSTCQVNKNCLISSAFFSTKLAFTSPRLLTISCQTTLLHIPSTARPPSKHSRHNFPSQAYFCADWRKRLG